MLILAAGELEARRDELTNSHFQSKLLKRVKLYSDNNIFIFPLSSLCGPCFVVYKKYYCTTHDNVTFNDDRTSNIVRPQHESVKLFYEQNTCVAQVSYEVTPFVKSYIIS